MGGAERSHRMGALQGEGGGAIFVWTNPLQCRTVPNRLRPLVWKSGLPTHQPQRSLVQELRRTNLKTGASAPRRADARHGKGRGGDGDCDGTPAQGQGVPALPAERTQGMGSGGEGKGTVMVTLHMDRGGQRSPPSGRKAWKGEGRGRGL